jgi:hypothetical protein
VTSSDDENSWPEIGFKVVLEKSEREKRLKGCGGVLVFLAAADIAL